jgi:hypothetical protein
MNHLAALRTFLAPPVRPTEAPSSRDLAQCEAILGRLPEDYKDYLRTYGTGCVADFIWIMNPSASNPNLNLLTHGERRLAAYREIRGDEGAEFPYRLFPEPGGLLPFGLTDNGDTLFWRTLGSPEDWTVVVSEARVPQYEEFALCTTAFLVAILRSAVRPASFPDDFPVDPSFRPEPFPL